MSNTVLVMGPSGTGKSTSIRNLDSTETFVINILTKHLPFRGSMSMYSEENKNYIETDKASTIVKYIEAINKRRPEIKTLIIDDITFVMNNEYMRRCQERQFDKFVDMGKNMFSIMDMCSSARDDLTCYLMSHVEMSADGMIIPRTVGKMTGDYVGLGERVTVALHSKIVDGEYKFLTQHDGTSYAKSPMGMFDDLYIANDLLYVNKAINEFYGEESTEKVLSEK